MQVDTTLTISKLELSGTVQGRQKKKIVELEGVDKLMRYIDTLVLPYVETPSGKAPRGATKFVLTYQEGTTLLLGINLNEAGLKYYELSTEQFEKLMALWAEMAS